MTSWKVPTIYGPVEYDPALDIPPFLKRSKSDAPKSIRRTRKKRIKVSVPKPPKSWRHAEKVRVKVAGGWPPAYPIGNRSCLVLRGKTKRGKFVRVREWPCYSATTYKVDREVFERSVIKGES